MLADVGDRMIVERTRMPRALVADVRLRMLADVAGRLTKPKVRKSRPLPDMRAFNAEVADIEAQMLADGELEPGE